MISSSICTGYKLMTTVISRPYAESASYFDDMLSWTEPSASLSTRAAIRHDRYQLSASPNIIGWTWILLMCHEESAYNLHVTYKHRRYITGHKSIMIISISRSKVLSPGTHKVFQGMKLAILHSYLGVCFEFNCLNILPSVLQAFIQL